jgi:hypothetical protein
VYFWTRRNLDERMSEREKGMKMSLPSVRIEAKWMIKANKLTERLKGVGIVNRTREGLNIGLAKLKIAM